MQEKFSPHTLYHLYNEGNNGQNIFFTHDNYLFFLWKMRRHLLPYADFLAYCLMPNHFDWLLVTKPSACEWSKARKPTKVLNGSEAPDHYQQNLSHATAVLLRSYSRAINKQEKRSGSLFRQKTKVKNSWIQDKGLTEDPFVFDNNDNEYPYPCFCYIHEKPIQAGFVEKAEDWLYSSALDYAGLRKGTLCNQQLAKEWIGLSIPR